ncbi:type II toxin-antitoxin system Phd/YefM family antitoxin [Fodinicola acaciae]|uniref:type II toxin-antitoxin system Phd/YefM family antitoxin n=1 Tax=Fodinicola acaciae TaxID=2681555 RepID=UPI0013D24E14|nr:type II toxin-antitoxin system prevent-host-death family antitoxin [Fodinicola acaciae]
MAAEEISQRDLRNRSGEIMDAIEQGQEFVVTRNGKPIGELIPLRRQRTVTREQFAAMSVNAAYVDADRFRADLDAAVDNDVRDPYAG